MFQRTKGLPDDPEEAKKFVQKEYDQRINNRPAFMRTWKIPGSIKIDEDGNPINKTYRRGETDQKENI